MRPALLAAALLLVACARDGGPARSGMRVVLQYELHADGVLVESTRERGTEITARLGSGELPVGLDEALRGLKPGDARVVELEPERAFGPRDPAKVESLPLAAFGPLAKDLKVGRRVGGARDGKAQEATVTRLSGASAELDFNHPLAGKRLTYKVAIVRTYAR